MPDQTNPLESSPARDALIQERARHLWEAEGSPAGGAGRYLEQADELVRMEQSGNPGQLPNPSDRPNPVPGAIVEEASIQQNLGEFPGGSSVADQGEWRETPMTRDELRHGMETPSERGEAP